MRRKLIITALLFIINFLAQHKTIAENTEQLSLKDVLKIAQENNIRIIETKKEVEQAKAKLIHARLYPNPEIDIGFYNLPVEVEKVRNDIEGRITQEIEILGKRNTRIKIAQDEIEISNEKLNLVWTEVRGEVKEKYYELLLKQKRKELSIENLDLTRKLLDSVQMKYNLGQVLLNEVIRAKIEVSQTENELLISDKEISLAKFRLNLLLNRNPNYEFNTTDELVYSEKKFNLESLIEKALNSNSELKIKIFLLSQKNKEFILYKKEKFPNLVMGIIGKQEEYEKFIGISLGVQIPVWYSNKGQILQTGIETQKLQKEIDFLKKELELKIRESFIESELADRQVVLFKKNLEQINELLRIIDLQYKEGRTDFLTYLESLKTIKKAKVDYYEMIFNYNKKLYLIEKIINE